MKKVLVECVHHLNEEFPKGETRITTEAHAKVLVNQGFVKAIREATPEDIAAAEKTAEKPAKKPAK